MHVYSEVMSLTSSACHFHRSCPLPGLIHPPPSPALLLHPPLPCMVLSLPQPVLRLPLVQAFPLVPQSPALSQYALQHICESMRDERRDFFLIFIPPFKELRAVSMVLFLL